MSKILTQVQFASIISSLEHATEIGATEYSLTTCGANETVIRFEMVMASHTNAAHFYIARRTILGILTGMEFFQSLKELRAFYA